MVCDDAKEAGDGEGPVIASQLYLYDDLTVGFADACQRIGIPVPALGRYNRTERREWRTYYDDDTASMVSARFARDLAWAAEHHPGRWPAP
jgi:hypothetical protein